VRAVEDALEISVPRNAELIRNLMFCTQYVEDHVVHFYHLHALDWVDIVSSLSADPEETSRIAVSISNWPRSSPKYFADVQNRLKKFAESGQLGIFANAYWGHPAYQLPPEVNLLAAAHYLQALEYQRTANKIVSILGSKTPHIQNLAVGGVANPINLDSQSTLTLERLFAIKSFIDELGAFVKQVYLPDVIAVGSMYPEWLGYGAGVTNYMAVPDMPLDEAGTQFDLPGGTIMNADLGSYKPISTFDDAYFQDNVEESIAHSWYDGDWQRHPWDEETVPKYTDWDDNGDYSWVKSPRFQDQPMQVGPLAQVLVGYVGGHEPTKRWLDKALDLAGAVAKTKLTPNLLHSTLGRHLARSVRTAVICEAAQKHWQLLVENIASGDTDIFEAPVFRGEQMGFGFHEAPRGTLSHFVVIENGKIKNYQAVVPSTWNAGPRDDKDRMGPYEASLIGNPIADPERPLEVLRTIHSFDPCLACAVHTFDPEGEELGRVRILG